MVLCLKPLILWVVYDMLQNKNLYWEMKKLLLLTNLFPVLFERFLLCNLGQQLLEV